MEIFIALVCIPILIVFFITYWNAHKAVVAAEIEVKKHYSDLTYLHKSAQDLMNDFILTIGSYGNEERHSVDNYYSMIERIVASGFGAVNPFSSSGTLPAYASPRVVELYSLRLAQLSKLHEQFNSHRQCFTRAVADYEKLRHTSVIPDALIGSSGIVENLSDSCLPFIDNAATLELIRHLRNNDKL